MGPTFANFSNLCAALRQYCKKERERALLVISILYHIIFLLLNMLFHSTSLHSLSPISSLSPLNSLSSLYSFLALSLSPPIHKHCASAFTSVVSTRNLKLPNLEGIISSFSIFLYDSNVIFIGDSPLGVKKKKGYKPWRKIFQYYILNKPYHYFQIPLLILIDNQIPCIMPIFNTEPKSQKE